VATLIAAAAASLVWMALEWCHSGKPSLIATATGTIAGLATVTPAAGYVAPAGGLVCGILGGILCYYATRFVLGRLLVDDSLDVFAVHGIGGILGTLLVAVLGAETFGGLGSKTASLLSLSLKRRELWRWSYGRCWQPG
jgi:Amt family ammonium transporter